MRTDRTDRIAASVARRIGVPDLPARLTGLDASPLGSLLLAVFRARTATTRPYVPLRMRQAAPGPLDP